MSLIANERTKLTATFLNTLGAGSIVSGIIGPLGAFIYHPDMLPASVFALGAGLFCGGYALHFSALAYLRRLQ